MRNPSAVVAADADAILLLLLLLPPLLLLRTWLLAAASSPFSSVLLVSISCNSPRRATSFSWIWVSIANILPSRGSVSGLVTLDSDLVRCRFRGGEGTNWS